MQDVRDKDLEFCTSQRLLVISVRASVISVGMGRDSVMREEGQGWT